MGAGVNVIEGVSITGGRKDNVNYEVNSKHDKDEVEIYDLDTHSKKQVKLVYEMGTLNITIVGTGGPRIA